MSEHPSLGVGVAWYKREQWALLKALSVDSDQMDNTYEAWLKGATSTFDRLLQEGVSVRKVDVDVRDLVRWCEERQVPLDGGARSSYAAEKLSSH